MKLFFKLYIFLFIVIFHIVSPLYAEELEGIYVIEVKKIDIGVLVWNISLTKNNYKISIELKSKGLLSGLYNFEGKYEATGLIKDKNLVPSSYSQVWLTKKKKRDVNIVFDDGLLIELILFPKETEHPRIKHVDIIDHLDPLSSFLNILMDNNQRKTVDGRRIYLMDVDEKNINGNIETKKILIKDYVNIWADHKRNDLEYIEISQDLNEKNSKMPPYINIKFKDILFMLSKI